MEYKKDSLRDYINTSELRIVNDNFRVRLSSALAKKYDAGVYEKGINRLETSIKEVESLNFVYPGRAKPIFYVYLVPDENFVDLLNYPPFLNAKAGGRPVSCFDLDGFNFAYGKSQNILENSPEKVNTSLTVNQIHELAHLVHGMFFSKNRLFDEGFAESLPLYTLNYEEKFKEHKDLITGLNSDQIYTAKELLNMEKEGSFGVKTRVPNKSCSFDWAYISSYLFVRGCMIHMEKNGLNRQQTTQQFLEHLKNSGYSQEWGIFDLADKIGLPHNELLNGKDLQISMLENIRNIKSR